MGRHIPDDGKITGAANKYLQVKTMVSFQFSLESMLNEHSFIRPWHWV